MNKDKRKDLYDGKFHARRSAMTLHAATTIIEALRSHLQIGSVVDFGCGTATWLYACEALGVGDVVGLEGEWLDTSQADISAEKIVLCDLEDRASLGRRFDLAMSLEVAEHLSPERASTFVADLCTASDTVLFGAAIPGQRGIHHINEQWQSYWAKKFLANDFWPFDFVRPLVWGNKEIPVWYKQNTILYIKKGTNNYRYMMDFAQNRMTPSENDIVALDIVHPQMYEAHTASKIGKALKALFAFLRNMMAK